MPGKVSVRVEILGPYPVLTVRDGSVRPYSPNLVKVVFSASRFEDRKWTILGSARTSEEPACRMCAVCNLATRRMRVRCVVDRGSTVPECKSQKHKTA